jgi:hypothetical protein
MGTDKCKNPSQRNFEKMTSEKEIPEVEEFKKEVKKVVNRELDKLKEKKKKDGESSR